PARQRNPHRLLLELFCMLDHLVGLLLRALIAQVTGAKPLQVHKERGAWFLFLPPYSPDLNPIEMAFAKLKAHLRRIGARTIDQLWRALGHICALYSPDECWNYLNAAGYASY
ncbi:MAG: transposase, partial [Sphingobium sp.]